MTPPRRSFAPILLGLALTVGLLALIGYSASKRRAAESAGAPQLTITKPARGETVDSPLAVHFTSTRPISLQPSGWLHGRLHLHANVNDVQFMPAVTDIRALDSMTYSWTLHGVGKGAARLYVGWGDPAHRELSQGASDTISVTIR